MSSALADPTQLSIVQARAELRSGALTSLALTQAYLDRIAEHNPRINAYITVTPELALQQARAADARIAAGEDTPLLGIPIAVKDLLTTKGVRTTAGSRVLENYTPVYDATVIVRLRVLGAVLLGKLNCDQFGMGSSNENSAYGNVLNPWDTTRVPGGSSGGSAAAVAADLCCAALGTDTGGSIRQPAALCGVTGLKNTYGRVSRYGLIAFSSSLDTIGALTKDATDAAVMLRALEGRDAHDSTSVDAAAYAPPVRQDLNGLRVGVPAEYFIDGMQPETEQAVRAAIDVLRANGASVKPISLPNTRLGLAVYYMIAPAEVSANMARFDGVKYGLRVTGSDLIDTYKQSRGAGLGAEVKRRIMLGTYALSAGYYDAYYIRAQKARTLIKRDFERAFDSGADGVDVIAAPTSPTTAFKFGDKTDDPLQMYLADVFTLPASLAGIPSISIPCGFDGAGLPIGFQLMGPAFGEDTLLAVAGHYQRLTSWHTRRPN
jgi:aspartyl-tRNA(Asn)/glutamyl-tRNA(Gln) amidotransferase subunit A